MKGSAIVSHLLSEGALRILAATYDLDTGVVSFLDPPKVVAAPVAAKAVKKTTTPVKTSSSPAASSHH